MTVTNLMVMAVTIMLVTKVGLEPETSHGAEEGDPESCMSCLVAVGKIQPSFQVRFFSTVYVVFYQSLFCFQ